MGREGILQTDATPDDEQQFRKPAPPPSALAEGEGEGEEEEED